VQTSYNDRKHGKCTHSFTQDFIHGLYTWRFGRLTMFNI